MSIIIEFLKVFILLFIIYSDCFAQEKIPKFTDYPVTNIYAGKNHPLAKLSAFENDFRTRLNDAIKNKKPSFAGHYIVTGWGCGSGGCNMGAVIDVLTGRAYPFPVGLTSVSPLKPEFENEDGQEHIFKLNSRLMIFAGDLIESEHSKGDDTIEFYEFKGDKFVFIKSIPYGKKDYTQ